tara:strand:+ start:1299 stop:1670 length:372 start_codon:yes stop_codon:yes gene_type:complete
MANVNDLKTIPGLGDFGSCYITGDGQKVDLNGGSATAYVCAIYVLTAVKFEVLENLNGDVRNISTRPVENIRTTTFGAATESTDISTGSSGIEFPAGTWLYGKWDNVELHAGSCICYLAPRGY